MGGETIHQGLDGVIVDTTGISRVIPEINSLVYRGYPAQELSEHCCFEEVAWLIWQGELPTAEELAEFQAYGRSQRNISKNLLGVIEKMPVTAHPMDMLRTAVSFLGAEDEEMDKNDAATNLQRSISMMAKIPTLIAAFHRLRKGQKVLPPRNDLGFSANFFYMIFGKTPDPEILKAFEVSLILYAEHGFNASTFTARGVVSTLSDIYSGVVGGIASLKGPLHGGANEAVMKMLIEIGDASKAKDWLLTKLRNKEVVMGFGHRVYKRGDSRVPIMRDYTRKVATLTGQNKWIAIMDVLETTMIKEKNIYPNLDFVSGPAYSMMGFDTDLFTPFFVMARVTGWTAHIMEQLSNNRLIRPLSLYTGPGERHVVPLEQRVGELVG